MKIITITLSPAFDIHCKSKSFLAEHENFAEITSYDAGGKGINLSRALMARGGESLAVVATGKENGANFLSALDRDSLIYKAIEVDGRIRENITVHPKDGKETRLSFSGFCADLSLLESTEKIINDYATDGDVVALVGSLPKGISANEAKSFVKSLKSRGIKVVIDSRSLTPDDIIECAPFLIKPNEEEITAYTSQAIDSLEDAARAALQIRQKGVENVMISLGAKGAVLASDDGIFSANAPKITALSTIGAGDSSLAGFLAAYKDGKDYEECLKTAVAYGSAACLTEGTKPPRREDIEKLFNTIHTKKAEF